MFERHRQQHADIYRSPLGGATVSSFGGDNRGYISSVWVYVSCQIAIEIVRDVLR